MIVSNLNLLFLSNESNLISLNIHYYCISCINLQFCCTKILIEFNSQVLSYGAVFFIEIFELRKQSSLIFPIDKHHGVP